MKKILIVSLMLFTVSSFCVADDMYAAFIKFDGVDGEAKFQGNSGWISLMNFKVGQVSAGGAILKPVVSFVPSKITAPNAQAIGDLGGMSFELTKWVDKSSPNIMSVFERRNRIPDAKLCLCSAQDHGEIFYTFELHGVMITEFNQQGNQEKLRLNFEKIEFR